MRRNGQWNTAVLMVPAMLAGLAGCTTATQTFPPPEPELRQQLAASPVEAFDDERVYRPRDPTSGIGRAAGEGAQTGAAVGLAPVTLCDPELMVETAGLSCLLGLAMAVVTVPVGAVVGAGVGAGTAHTEEEVEAASASLNAALAELTLSEDLFDHFQAISVSHQIGPLPMVAESAAHEIESPDDADEGSPDRILEIGVIHLSAESRGEWDPDLSIGLMARARLLRPSDNSVIYQRIWEYRSPWRNYFEMAEDDAALLRSAIETGLEQLADSMVTDLFLTTELEAHPLGPVPEGEVWTTGIKSR